MQGILRFDLQIVFLDIGHSVFWRAKLFFQISLELSWMVGEAFDCKGKPYKCKTQIVFTKESTPAFFRKQRLFLDLRSYNVTHVSNSNWNSGTRTRNLLQFEIFV